MALDEIQIKALCLIAAGNSSNDVVAQTGVTKRTIDRWRTQPEFKRMLQNAMAEMYDSAVAELVLGARDAAKILKEIINNEEVPTKNKISAINILLSNAARAKDGILEQRLERLESEKSADLAFKQQEIKRVNDTKLKFMGGKKVLIDEITAVGQEIIDGVKKYLTEEEFEQFTAEIFMINNKLEEKGSIY